MTKRGHGLYALAGPDGGFADFRVGVLKTGFLPQWMSFLGHDISGYSKDKPSSAADLDKVPARHGLFDPRPIRVDARDRRPFCRGLRRTARLGLGRMRRRRQREGATALNATPRKATSTYGLFLDRSGEISIDTLNSAGWPLAEIRRSTISRVREPRSAPAWITRATTYGGWRSRPILRHFAPTPRSSFRRSADFGITGRLPRRPCTRSRSWRAIYRAPGDAWKAETRISISPLCKPRWRSGNVFSPNTSSRASREKPCAPRNPGACSPERPCRVAPKIAQVHPQGSRSTHTSI